DQISKMKTSYEKEKKTNAKTIKQLTNQVQNLTNSQVVVNDTSHITSVQEKAKIYQLESENIKLRKQLEQSKTQVDDVELMKEEIARLQAENITLKFTPKRKDSISDVANKVRSAFVPATPPESPCNSRPSSDAFSLVHEGILEDATEGNSIVTNGDWVTVRKRGSKGRRGSIRLRSGSRGGRK
ncbi:11339_t:CDS:2, partial [Acaulospora morrowiae]